MLRNVAIRMNESWEDMARTGITDGQCEFNMKTLSEKMRMFHEDKFEFDDITKLSQSKCTVLFLLHSEPTLSVILELLDYGAECEEALDRMLDLGMKRIDLRIIL